MLQVSSNRCQEKLDMEILRSLYIILAYIITGSLHTQLYKCVKTLHTLSAMVDCLPLKLPFKILPWDTWN